MGAVLLAGLALFFLATAFVAWHADRSPFLWLVGYTLFMVASALCAGAAMDDNP